MLINGHVKILKKVELEIFSYPDRDRIKLESLG